MCVNGLDIVCFTLYNAQIVLRRFDKYPQTWYKGFGRYDGYEVWQEKPLRTPSLKVHYQPLSSTSLHF